ncbi:hypothetical protein RJT34_18285 [Clitoria ternatea]|uniref:Dof-type domain-containing protein n=1 Tax=Clitoria ternatea TaxID=43366 RepID=A0AAN9JCR1_CLITE
MSEAKEPAIKLFGMTIPVPEIPPGSGDPAGAPASFPGDVVDDGHTVDQNNNDSSTNSSRESHTNTDEQEEDINKDTLGEKPNDDKREDATLAQSSEEFTNPDTTSRTGEESISLSTEREATTSKTPNTEEEQGDTSQSQGKNLKKPDKILPCPRCNSMDTKFCYHNNYNVNQPRHFCKNCQRYWTAGGTMRNVPVGAGRRKNKNSSSHYRQITVSEAALQSPPQQDLPNGSHHPSLKCNGTVLTFGSDAPLCESIASVLNHADKTVQNYTRNGFHKPEELRIPAPHASREKGDVQSNKSSVTSTKSMEGANTNGSQDQTMKNCQNLQPQVPYFPGTPWPFPWNTVQWSSPVPPSAFYPPGFTVPFYPPTAYWGCAVSGPWNIPWLAQPSSPNGATSSSGPNSPTLGKHSREDNMLKSDESNHVDKNSKQNNKEKCLWFPKTLRIDDSGEAAKSSIWTTLGIKTGKEDSIPGGGGGLFKALPSKYDEKNHPMQASRVLQANPAALSRSLNFHESS